MNGILRVYSNTSSLVGVNLRKYRSRCALNADEDVRVPSLIALLKELAA